MSEPELSYKNKSPLYLITYVLSTWFILKRIEFKFPDIINQNGTFNSFQAEHRCPDPRSGTWYLEI